MTLTSGEEIPPVPIVPDGIAKRWVDILLASLGLFVLSPVFLLCAILAKVQSPGTALFWSPRVGRGGRRFLMAKFRTMVADAPDKGPGVTAQDDPRMTPIGRFLRRTKLDELPQLLNVLNGTMSLVGPRPELPRYVACYNERQRRVLSVRPGITGPTQLAYRHEQDLLKGREDVESYYIHVLMPAKLEMDLDYIETRSFWSDMGYLLKTLAKVFS